ncbi:hypothetical protein FQZ97_755090 [compost metagenome]
MVRQSWPVAPGHRIRISGGPTGSGRQPAAPLHRRPHPAGPQPRTGAAMAQRTAGRPSGQHAATADPVHLGTADRRAPGRSGALCRATAALPAAAQRPGTARAARALPGAGRQGRLSPRRGRHSTSGGIHCASAGTLLGSASGDALGGDRPAPVQWSGRGRPAAQPRRGQAGAQAWQSGHGSGPGPAACATAGDSRRTETCAESARTAARRTGRSLGRRTQSPAWSRAVAHGRNPRSPWALRGGRRDVPGRPAGMPGLRRPGRQLGLFRPGRAGCGG